MTRLHWKIIPTWLHLKKEVDIRIPGRDLWTERDSRTNQATPDFREAKQKCIGLYNEHVERTGEGNSPIHPALQTRQHDQQFEGRDEYNYTVDPRTGWRFYHFNQTNNFVFVSALGAARRLEVESKLGFLAIFNLDSTVFFSFFFFLVDVVVFRLLEIPIPGNRRGSVDRYTCHTSLFNTYSHCTACSHCTAHSSHGTRVAQDKDCVSHENTSTSCASCLTPWHMLHAALALCPHFPHHPVLPWHLGWRSHL